MDKPFEGSANLDLLKSGRKPRKAISQKGRRREKRFAQVKPASKSPRRTLRRFPASSFEEALDFAKSIQEAGGGGAVRRLTLFNEIGKSPESSASRQIITNASKYGLVKGNYKSEQLELTPDAVEAIDEEIPYRQQAKARVKLAIEAIEIFDELFRRFVGSKLPAKRVLIDAAKEFGIDNDLAEEAVDIFIVNLKFVGLLKTLSGAERIVTVDHLLDSIPVAEVSGLAENDISENVGGNSELSAFEDTCFYVAPIGEAGSDLRKHSDLFLGSIVEPAVEPFNLKVYRADAIDKPGIITKQVLEYLIKARLVIVDLSHHNPNVFYELAIRHMMRLPVVQIIRSSDKVPFDVAQMRTVNIDDSDVYTLVPKIESYRSEISNQIRRALQDPDSVDNPINTHFPLLKAALP